MRLIIAGSRECTDYAIVKEAVDKGIEELGITPTDILSGKAAGVDSLGEQYAKEHGINILGYPAKWKDIKGKDPKYIKSNAYGKYYSKAGLDRNELMAQNADALIAINLGTSGTEHMIEMARKYNLKVYVYEPDSEEVFGCNFWE